MIRFTKFIRTLTILAFVLGPNTNHAQEVKQLAEQIGIKFGSPLQHLHDPNYVQLYADQINGATIMAYWKYTTHINEGEYTWDETDHAVALAESMNAYMHGHPLVWGSDVHIPDWVKVKPHNEAEAIMNDHIQTVVSRYIGKIELWDVVNEAIEDDGTYRDSYWNRAMTGQYIIEAFRTAHQTDPSIDLIYNDYGIESNGPKFETVKSLMGWIQSEDVGVVGLGWQLHVHVNEVLDPAFPLEARMQEISDMGLENYVTELDIRVDNNSAAELEKQKQAYKKITSIYLNNPTRGDYFQTWGLSDRYTWWNDFDDSQIHYPLPFDENMQKKSAYWGIVEAMTEYLDANTAADTNPNPVTNEYRIRNVGQQLQLSQTVEELGANVNLQNLNPEWYSQQWALSDGPANTMRFACKWNDQYLNSPDILDQTSSIVSPLTLDYWSMMWFVEPVSANVFRIKNRWADKYLTALANLDVGIADFDPNSSDQLWLFEPLNGDCPDTHFVDYPVDGQSEFIQTADWIRANNTVTNNGSLEMRAGNQVELEAGFEADKGSTVLAQIEACNNSTTPPPSSPLSNPNANQTTRDIYDFLNTMKDDPNQCIILGQNIGWSFETYNETVVDLETQTNQWLGLIGGQMRYTSTEIDYPALVTRYANWQANGGLCELSVLPDNPWTGGNAWDRSVTSIEQLTIPGSPGYAAWRTQLDFYADVLLDMQNAGVTILFRPLMEMNGDWFWYGSVSGQNNQQALIDLYRDMYDYYTNTKQLNNLIWVYSANMAFTGIPDVDFYYPGDDVVDMTGLDVYANNLALPISQYQSMINLGKPFAFTEFGPNHNNMDGTHDYLSLIHI